MSAGAAWPLVVQSALLGTERAAARAWPEAPPAVAPLLARLDAGDAEGALLGAAALLSAYATAGRLPAPAAGDPAAPAPPDAADAPEAPAGPARLLSSMLARAHAEALPEWLTRAAARGWRAPSLALPALLAFATATTALRPALAAVLGGRGRWLAAQRDDWRWAVADTAPPDDEALEIAWQTGTPAERAALLGRVRAADAARGRALLESTWAEEPPTQRAALVAALDAGLSSDDEPFLERALDDRRQEVRRAAAVLLARLPDGALVARMTALARVLLRHEAGGLLRRARLHVEPPAAHDAALARDGVERAPPAGVGERAWWLAQIVGAVPPSTWSGEWRAEPAALIRLAADGEWAQPVLEGWSTAAARFGDPAWSAALLASDAPDLRAPRLAPTRAALLAALPAAARERLVAGALRERPYDADVVPLVLDAAHDWSEPFARVVLDWLRRRAGRAGDPGEWQLREALPRLALRVPPSLATVAAAGWPDDAPDRGWARPVERFLALLAFRHEIAQELAR